MNHININWSLVEVRQIMATFCFRHVKIAHFERLMLHVKVPNTVTAVTAFGLYYHPEILTFCKNEYYNEYLDAKI